MWPGATVTLELVAGSGREEDAWGLLFTSLAPGPMRNLCQGIGQKVTEYTLPSSPGLHVGTLVRNHTYPCSHPKGLFLRFNFSNHKYFYKASWD